MATAWDSVPGSKSFNSSANRAKYAVPGLIMIAIEVINIIVHALLYNMSSVIGRDLLVWEFLGVAQPPLLPDLSISMVISGVIAIMAVILPIIIWSLLFSYHRQIFDKASAFFRDPLHMLITAILVTLYALVLWSEISIIQARIVEDTGPLNQTIPILGSEPVSKDTVVAMSAALVAANFFFGMVSGYLFNRFHNQ